MDGKFLSRFTPSLLPPATLEATFVQREDLAGEIVDIIREASSGAAHRHMLLVGPRGIGKTHLAAVVCHRVRAQPDITRRLTVAWLREEEWGITSFLDLLIRVLQALAEVEGGEQFTGAIEHLFTRKQQAATQEALELLERFTNDKALVVIIENTDEVLAGLGQQGCRELRRFLTDTPQCLVLATSVTRPRALRTAACPLGDIFDVRQLKALDFENAIELLSKIASHKEKPDLAAFVREPRGKARVRAVHHLIGGNHRLYVIFSDFLTCESLDELVDPVMRTLDDLTPYYQSRVASLSPQQRKIIHILCDQRNALPVKQIAKRCFASHQTVSSQLRTLKDAGYVASFRHGRESYYEIREPLMRICLEVKKERGRPLRLLVTFLRVWYSRQELSQWLEHLATDSTVKAEYIRRALDEPDDGLLAKARLALRKDWDQHFHSGDYSVALGEAEEMVAMRADPASYAALAASQWALGRFDEAYTSYREGIRQSPDRGALWACAGLAARAAERHTDAEECLTKACELGVRERSVGRALGMALHDIGQDEKALKCFDLVVAAAGDDHTVWSDRALPLITLGRLEEALSSYARAEALKHDYLPAIGMQGAILHMLGRPGDALACFDRALEIDDKIALAWQSRGEALLALGDATAASEAFDKAVGLDPEDAAAAFGRVRCLVASACWDEALVALSGALGAFAENDEVADLTMSVVSTMLQLPEAATGAERHASALVAIYAGQGREEDLGTAVGTTFLRALPELDQALARGWHAAWKRAAEGRESFEVSLRLIGAACDYRDTGDERVLYGLASEERELVTQALGVSLDEEE